MSQPQDPLSPKFAQAILPFDDQKWGFLIVRTARYDQDSALDTLQWSTAMQKVRSLAGREFPNGPPDEISLPVLSDPSLTGLSFDKLRTRFKTWVDDFSISHASTNEYGDVLDGFGTIQCDIRRNCFLVIDDASLKSITDYVPDPMENAWENRGKPRQERPWAIVVDRYTAIECGYNGGGPYPGWLRTQVPWLWELFDAIEMLDGSPSVLEEQICTTRRYAGQILLYNGVGVELIDPEGGLEGAYKFPHLPGRGRQEKEDVDGIIEEIEKATGKRLGHDACECDDCYY